jgi:hypothetical protein
MISLIPEISFLRLSISSKPPTTSVRLLILAVASAIVLFNVFKSLAFNSKAALLSAIALVKVATSISPSSLKSKASKAETKAFKSSLV